MISFYGFVRNCASQWWWCIDASVFLVKYVFINWIWSQLKLVLELPRAWSRSWRSAKCKNVKNESKNRFHARKTYLQPHYHRCRLLVLWTSSNTYVRHAAQKTWPKLQKSIVINDKNIFSLKSAEKIKIIAKTIFLSQFVLTSTDFFSVKKRRVKSLGTLTMIILAQIQSPKPSTYAVDIYSSPIYAKINSAGAFPFRMDKMPRFHSSRMIQR